MNEDNIKKTNKVFEERSGAKVPRPGEAPVLPRRLRKKTREPLKNGTTCLNTPPRR